MEIELDGRRALVHAASAGVGRASARALAAAGASVAVASSDAGRAGDAATEIAAATGAETVGVEADLTGESSTRAGTTRAREVLGGLDVLVTNHPGTPHGSVADHGVDAFDRAYEATVRSTVVAVEAALPALRDGGGSIVNVVAASAREPPANHLLSNTLRPALFGLSKSRANDLAPDVRVNCACPRDVETDRVEAMVEARAETEGRSPDEVRTDRTERVPLGRFGQPSEFGDCVAFLASDRASFVTGETLAVDGGWLRSA